MPLSHAKPKILGLVLAAGRGRRFDPSGQQQKLAAVLPDGESVLRASCRRLLPWVDALLVVIGPHSARLLPPLDGLAVQAIVCPDADQGLGTSLAFGLAARQPESGWIVALGDMPFVAASTYAAVRRAIQAGADAARPVWHGQPGHPVAVSVKLRDRFALISPKQGLAPLFQGPGVALQRLAVDDPGCIHDIDVPSDLASSP